MNIFNDALWPYTVNQENSYEVVINNKFIFIQIPKTGTTSVVTELKKVGLTQHIKCFRHEGIKYIQHLYSNKNTPVYAIVRNPFRQTLSYFFHRVNYGEIFVNKDNIIMEFRNWCKGSNLSGNIHLLQTKYLETNNVNIKNKIKIFNNFDNCYGVYVKYNDVVYKIAFFGFHISQNVLTHGISFNFNNDLREFKNIIPCGLQNIELISLDILLKKLVFENN